MTKNEVGTTKKKTILISFSGGRTSGYMTKWLLDNKSNDYNFIVVFANTGQEHEKTLEFINECDKHYNFKTVWVEAVVHHGIRKGNTHKIVTYDTATRDKTLFEEMIKKHGIPNKAFPHCTRELKLCPINSYMRSLGLKPKDYLTAIGIRADEMRRVRKDATTAKIIYPLVDWISTDKQDVLDWWETREFDLEIEEHQGNCTWCWKKSTSKHLKLMGETPVIFDVPLYLEATYPNAGAHKDKTLPRTFFRGHQSTEGLIELFKEVSLGNQTVSNPYENSGCSESCELYPTDSILKVTK